MKDKQSRTEKLLLAELYMQGLHPKPQFQISSCHVDFAFPKHNLVVEVDGPYHNTKSQKQRDMRRNYYLKSKGWKIMRFKASKVHKYSSFIAKTIKKQIRG